MKGADTLLVEAVRGPPIGSDVPNLLLAEFQRGYPLSRLRLLLRAENHNAVAAGVWIASELGTVARPLFQEIVELARHPESKVRFFVLDSMQSIATAEDAEAIIKAFDLMSDRSSSVRWKALVFAAHLPDSLIAAAQDSVARTDPGSPKEIGLQLLRYPTEAKILAALDGSDLEVRSYAASAAARMSATNVAPLRYVLRSMDNTIRQFGEDMAQRAGIVVDT